MPLGFYYSQAQDWCHPGGIASRINKRKTARWDPARDGGKVTLDLPAQAPDPVASVVCLELAE